MLLMFFRLWAAFVIVITFGVMLRSLMTGLTTANRELAKASVRLEGLCLFVIAILSLFFSGLWQQGIFLAALSLLFVGMIGAAFAGRRGRK